ncbi:hypothetical protein Sru01_33920 [Sphaerisporangium rufum]|uniref:Pyruvate, water dikinase n=1 Tax=Sphaerisporangium rufum TaxID=1381558 RepID=A0A919R726_9ACTN|nr:PEP/pyruvate-binding domain-containing protein [Sphaerisporangium rufum]GII78410.1 hypothetical protein Sru01_33920 [Sphaerisporangium rufum]
MTDLPYVLPLADDRADLAAAGGKGSSLARLAAAGLPVPAGFHVTTAAYEAFLAAAGLAEPVVAAASGAASPEAAERAVADLFDHAGIPEPVAAAVRKAYSALGSPAVAVRSSATAEDLPDLSFAGQQETFLNVQGEAAVLAAVKNCWASLWGARAIAYRDRNGVDPGEISTAVVVQELVPADAAGVLFTVDPVSGAAGRMTIDAAWGLGESVVGGGVTADTVVAARPDGRVVERRTGDKAVMTVRTADGTAEVPVPADRRDRQVLDDGQVAELVGLGEAVERLYGRPMDVEWAWHDGAFFVLQARPITGAGRGPAETWNDSLAGDYLWTSGNLGEAIPDIMTPATWSFVRSFMQGAMRTSSVPGMEAYGRIGGRFYMNLSMAATLAATFGMRRRFAAEAEAVFGRIPPGMEIPLVPISRWKIIRRILPSVIRLAREIRGNIARLPAFCAAAPARCTELRERIAGTADPGALAALWRDEAGPYVMEASFMLEAATRQDPNALTGLRDRLSRLVGPADAAALATGLHSAADGGLASLGPLVGLERLARGEIDQETFAREWGHRGPSEFEVSIPRPAEQPDWVERRLAGLRDAEYDVAALLARQQEAREAAWRRLAERHPDKVRTTRRDVARMTKALRSREIARSEVIRAVWVCRAFVLRAGELTGRGDDLFFLDVEEILSLLGGDEAPLAKVAARRAAYEGYRALPVYPTLIRGRFDPFRWAADPNRRHDVFDEHDQVAAPGGTLRGFPGSAGIVQGPARVVTSLDEGEALRPGEILVTTVTNVGWTPLFPRAAAVVTDVGAPLSHAAIVARELGIPAVVGCGDATARLRTGDLVRVDGEHGTVDIISQPAAPVS